MMSCGTTSKNTGKKSSPWSHAKTSSSATRASNMCRLPWLQKLLQHLPEFFLMGDRHAQKVGLRDALQGILQRAGRRVGLANPAIEARIIAVANLAVPHHATVRQEGFHQCLADGVIVWEIVTIGEVKQIGVPALGLVMLLQMCECHLIGGRTARAAAVGDAKKVLLRHYLGLRVVGNEYHLDLAVLELQKAHHPEVKTFGNVFFAGGHGAANVHQHVDGGIGVYFFV